MLAQVRQREDDRAVRTGGLERAQLVVQLAVSDVAERFLAADGADERLLRLMNVRRMTEASRAQRRHRCRLGRRRGERRLLQAEHTVLTVRMRTRQAHWRMEYVTT